MGWNDKMENETGQEFEYFIDDDDAKEEIEKYAREEETETGWHVGKAAENGGECKDKEKGSLLSRLFGKKSR